MKALTKILLSVVLVLAVTVSSVACKKEKGGSSDADSGSGKENGTVYSVSLLLNGWTNTPTSSDDPYRAWIKQNYGLDISLNATTDFTNSVMIEFSSKKKPDIISFPDFTSFQALRNQGVLLEDWTPYLEKMPNFKKLLSGESQAFTKQVLTNEKGKLNALWTPSTPPTWSLKIREDWADEYRAMNDAYDENGNKTSSLNAYIPAGA
ncbi:MAG: hypothetical protein J6Z34_00950, partial [Clostridia bacterium]|nr:hypothetical protein [Clostridia bacterium]